jgi:CRISPR-associated protein Cas6
VIDSGVATPHAPTAADAAVDVVFPLHARSLPRDHAQALQQALCAQLPWLATEPLAGIHPIKLVHGLGESALLSQRVRLLLRVSASRALELLALPGLSLQVVGQALQLGPAHQRSLQAHGTLYAYRVAADSADEVAFMATVADELVALGIGGLPVCGLHHHLHVAGRLQDTFSLMLHQLTPAHSLLLQQRGLGPQRLLGCGLFVPHKSTAPV